MQVTKDFSVVIVSVFATVFFVVKDVLGRRESGKTVLCPLNDQWPVKPLGESRFGAWWFGGRFGVTEWTASNVGDLVGFFEVRFWVGLSVEEVGQVARPIASKVPGFWGP